jgi:hypothetical protein
MTRDAMPEKAAAPQDRFWDVRSAEPGEDRSRCYLDSVAFVVGRP